MGPTTSEFIIDQEHGRHIQLFLNEENYNHATKLALNEHACNISDGDILQQSAPISCRTNAPVSLISERNRCIRN